MLDTPASDRLVAAIEYLSFLILHCLLLICFLPFMVLKSLGC